MSQAQSIKTQVAHRPVSHRFVFVEGVVALIVVTLALAVLICLAAIAPAMWAFATAAAAESYIPVGPSQCLPIKTALADSPVMTSSRDGLRRAPWPLRRRSAKYGGGGDHLHAPHLDTACRTSWKLTEWNDG